MPWENEVFILIMMIRVYRIDWKMKINDWVNQCEKRVVII